MLLNLLHNINKIPVHCYCTNNTLKNKLYSSTVLLPKTKFPLKLEGKKLQERDETINNNAEFKNLYSWQRSNLCEPEFILHDGPPYANGAPHMGHAINKILKDTVLRSKILTGNKVHYVPGWDCHGLPIELKALSNSDKLSAIEIRSKAKRFASKTIDGQKKAFESWGVIGDWKNVYKTYNVDYVKNQFRQFYKLYKKKYIYRDLKPVYWSPSSKTALAEAELEYNEKHKSISVYVRVPILDIPGVPSLKSKKVFALIWTTTPWTLPANQLISYSSSLFYSLVKKDDDIYIIATDLLEDVSKNLDTNFQLLNVVKGDLLQNTTYSHPIYKNTVCKFYDSSNVTNTKGTGLVHSAPAHGPEDFLVALENKIPIVDLVDEAGCYKSEAGSDLKGKFVLSEGTDAVLKLIKDNLMKKSDFVHSYPYDWRTKQPVIIKASRQWFMDTNAIKIQAIEALENVEILPKSNSSIYKNNLINQVRKRPYWCISRQRKWGVPIPVVYDKTTSDALLNEELLENYLNLLEKHGTDFWWKLPKEELLPNELDLENIEKSEDILDIWFDSGISWSKVLDGSKIADMYLEGVDQFNGWFQSSLMTSVALRGKAPYKTIYVHGFAMDENGLKMSKSVGNVVDPFEIINGGKNNAAYGVDTLRWWVCCHANQSSIANVSHNVLKSSADEVQKIRSVLRFSLGCLADYEKSEKDFHNLLLIDRYMLHLLSEFYEQGKASMDQYHFHKIGIAVINLLTNPVSALYYNAIKDRMYCDEADSLTRKAAQYTLLQIFNVVTQLIAPILPHLVEEMYMHLSGRDAKSYFTSKHLEMDAAWKNEEVAEVMDLVLNIKRDLNKEKGASTSDCILDVSLSGSQVATLKKIISIKELELQLIDILQVSRINIKIAEDYKLEIIKSGQFSCPRCRRVHSDKPDEICERCNVLLNNNNTQSHKSSIVN